MTTSSVGRLLPPHSIEALVLDFDVPPGLRRALDHHRLCWLAILRSGNTAKVEQELKDPAVHSYVRARYIEDFGRLCATVLHGEAFAALLGELRRGTLTLTRGVEILEIEDWLRHEGQRLEPLRVDLEKPGSEAQRRAFLRGLYESTDDLVTFRFVAKDAAYEAAQTVTSGFRAKEPFFSSALETSRFARSLRAARARRRRRTGGATPSLRATGRSSFSVQSFRKTELCRLIAPLFRPVVPVTFQRGPQLSARERDDLGDFARGARRWLAQRHHTKAKRPTTTTPVLKAGVPPTAAIQLSVALIEQLAHLQPDDMRALRAVLTTVAANIDYRALPRTLGLGSGVAALRRVRKLQQAPEWPVVVAVLSAHRETRDLHERLLRARRPFKRRRRIG